VLESWSAVYTRSFAEIGCAPGSAGACVTAPIAAGAEVCCGDPQADKPKTMATTVAMVVLMPPLLRVAE
jgi:hypothetical protein